MYSFWATVCFVKRFALCYRTVVCLSLLSCLRKWHISPPLFAHVYCGHGRPSQLLLSSCFFFCHVHVFFVFHLGLYYHYVMNKDVQKVPLMRFH